VDDLCEHLLGDLVFLQQAALVTGELVALLAQRDVEPKSSPPTATQRARAASSLSAVRKITGTKASPASALISRVAS
jgi:hypothetical protein